jgi:hypothetical protein
MVKFGFAQCRIAYHDRELLCVTYKTDFRLLKSKIAVDEYYEKSLSLYRPICRRCVGLPRTVGVIRKFLNFCLILGKCN